MTGVVAEDPIAEWLIGGQLPEDTDHYFADWLKTIQDYQKVGRDLKTVLINTAVYHNGGANAVQEIAHLIIGSRPISIGRAKTRAFHFFSFRKNSIFVCSRFQLLHVHRQTAGCQEALGRSC